MTGEREVGMLIFWIAIGILAVLAAGFGIERFERWTLETPEDVHRPRRSR